jgi:hypothetical protein
MAYQQQQQLEQHILSLQQQQQLEQVPYYFAILFISSFTHGIWFKELWQAKYFGYEVTI